MATKYMDKATLVKAIASIAARGKKLDADIQVAAVSVINHVGLHGDITVANNLFNAMPRGSRRNALALHLVTFGKLAINMGENRKESPFVFDREAATDLVGAENSKWYEMIQEPDVTTVLDVRAEVGKLLAKIAKAEKAGKPVDLGGLDLEQLRAMTVESIDPLAELAE